MIVDPAWKTVTDKVRTGDGRVRRSDNPTRVRAGVDRREVSDVAEQFRNLAKRLHAAGATLLAQRAHSLASQADQEVRRRELSPWLK